MSVIDHISSFQQRPHELYVALVIPWSLLPGAMVDEQAVERACSSALAPETALPLAGSRSVHCRHWDRQMDWQHP